MNPGRLSTPPAMSGAVAPRSEDRLRRAVAVLLASTTKLMRGFVVVVYALFVLIAALVGLTGEFIGTVALLAVGTAALWGLWLSRIVLLHIDARSRRMPALARDLPWALGLAAVATVLIPALLLAAVGADFTFALSALCAAAMLGLAGAMLPASWYLGLCFAPMLLVLASRAIEALLGPDARLPFDFDLAQLPPLAALLALAALWRWRAIVRQAGMPDAPAWRRPMVTSALRGTSWGDVFSGDAQQWRGQLPDWLWPAGKAEHCGPGRPVRTIRCLLGTPFAPISARQMAIQLCIAALVLVYLLDFGNGSDMAGGMTGALVGGLCGGGTTLVLMYSQRLAAMCKRSSAELSELALLPGLGDAPRARQRLLQAVAWAPGAAYGIALILLLALVVKLDISAAGSGLLLASVVGLAMMTALACLRPLAGSPAWPIGMVLLFAPAGVLVAVTAGVAVNAHGAAIAWPWFAALWALLYLVFGYLLLDTWRRLHARPHAFVQQAS